MDFDVPTDHRVNIKENETKDKYLDLVGELKKNGEYEDDGDTNCNRRSWNGFQRLRKSVGRIGNRGTNRNYSNSSIVKIGQNIEKSPGDLKKFAETPVKDHQLTLAWKTLKQ